LRSGGSHLPDKALRAVASVAWPEDVAKGAARGRVSPQRKRGLMSHRRPGCCNARSGRSVYGRAIDHPCAPRQGLHNGTWIARRRPLRRIRSIPCAVVVAPIGPGTAHRVRGEEVS